MTKPPVFVLKTGGFGPSGETRTRGILVPNRVIIFFLIFFSPFRAFYSERSCFPELFAPLFPGVRILSMVKNVVKSKHSPKGNSAFGERFRLLKCRDCSSAGEISQVISEPKLSRNKQRLTSLTGINLTKEKF